MANKKKKNFLEGLFSSKSESLDDLIPSSSNLESTKELTGEKDLNKTTVKIGDYLKKKEKQKKLAEKHMQKHEQMKGQYDYKKVEQKISELENAEQTLQNAYKDIKSGKKPLGRVINKITEKGGIGKILPEDANNDDSNLRM
jgi:hypothetical protein